jgi:hypothetical protein
MKVFLGFDPGGQGKFGWAVCIGGDDGLNVLDTGIADHAKEAVESALKVTPQGKSVAVAGAGIDAPMFWVFDEGLEADRLVRTALARLGARSPGGTVQHFNSLRGACVIQGLLVLELMRRAYPTLPVTEAHPKALLWLMGIARRGYEPEMVRPDDIKEINCGSGFDSEDERDAILGAFTAWAMIGRKTDWVDLLKYEKEERILAGELPIGYWMPKNLIIEGTATPGQS